MRAIQNKWGVILKIMMQDSFGFSFYNTNIITQLRHIPELWVFSTSLQFMKKEYDKWTQAEKDTLSGIMVGYEANGAVPVWKAIAAQVGSKSVRQCYDEWIILKRAKETATPRHIWSQQEEAALHRAVREFGDDWEAIQERALTNLTVQQLKNKVRIMGNGRVYNSVYNPKSNDADVLANLLTQVLKM